MRPIIRILLEFSILCAAPRWQSTAASARTAHFFALPWGDEKHVSALRRAPREAGLPGYRRPDLRGLLRDETSDGDRVSPGLSVPVLGACASTSGRTAPAGARLRVPAAARQRSHRAAVPAHDDLPRGGRAGGGAGDAAADRRGRRGRVRARRRGARD